MSSKSGSGPFGALEGHNFMSLTTFRASGQPVTTPVWFAAEGDKLYMVTEVAMAKAKRMRNDPRVRVAPSTAVGKPLGPAVDAVARVLAADEAGHARRRLRHKYGFQVFGADLIHWIRRRAVIYLEIAPRRTPGGGLARPEGFEPPTY